MKLALLDYGAGNLHSLGKALEGAGLKQVAIQVVTNGKEMIEEFSREVIAKY